MAQLARVLALGARGSRFKSGCPDLDFFIESLPMPRTNPDTNIVNLLHGRSDVAEMQRLTTKTVITSKEIELPFRFDTLVTGTTGIIPMNSSILTEIKIIKDNRETDWIKTSLLEYQQGSSFPSEKEYGFGEMDVDIFMAEGSADSFKYRITTRGRASVSNIYSTLTKYDGVFDLEKAAALNAPEGILIEVPQISQFQHGEDEGPYVCSPACVTMLLNFYGHKVTLDDIAPQVYDPCADIFGNWVINAACAGSYGTNAVLKRFETLQQLYDNLAYAIPVIASISYKKGELKGARIEETKGHLVLIKGIDENGNIVVNDPAAKTDEQVHTVYDRKEFAQAWLGNKRGIAYLIEAH